MIRDTFHSMRQSVSARRLRQASIVVGLCILLALSMAPVSAQFGDPAPDQEYSDDFEDGNVDGWSGGDPQAVQESFNGDWSLEVEDGIPEGVGQTEWDAGPVLDLQEEFRVEGTIRSNEAASGGANVPRRIGIFQAFGEGVMLIFRSDQATTFLATQYQEDPAGHDTINDNFDDVWVDFVIESEGDGTVRAKVWESGAEEPANFQLEREFGSQSGQFAIEPGSANEGRVYNLDDVFISGQEVTDPDLTIDTGQLLQHGESHPYEVTYVQTDPQTGENETVDVTDDATVTSLNTDGLTVDESTNELVATDNESFNERVAVQAEYNGSVAYTEVAVASPTVENLEVLPPVWRIGAFLGDWTVFLFIVSIGAGIVGTRIATSFMGLSMMEMVLLIGWFGGYISTGLIMTSVFACLFIGLNLAANIDYQVQR